MSAARHDWKRGAGVAAAIVVATLLAYGRLPHNDFLFYDDQHYLVENAHVNRGLSVAGLRWAFTTDHAGNWHPVTWLSHQLDCQLFGLRPAWHHGVNLALHLASSLVLLGIVWGMTARLGPAALVAALFALHPLNVESVAWASERKNVLSTLLWLLTMAAYLGWVRCKRWPYYLACVGLMAVGLMAKPMLVTLPCALLLLDVWPLGRLAAPAAGKRARDSRWPARLAPLLIEKAPLLALSAASSWITVRFMTVARADWQTLPLSARLQNAAVGYASYLRKLIWPDDLAVLYQLTVGQPTSRWAWSLALLVAIAAICLVNARRRPYLLVGWLWYLGTLVPVSGISQAGIQLMADRFTYVPMIGVFLMIAMTVDDLATSRPTWARPLTALELVALVACGAATWRQVGYWRDTGALFEQVLRVEPENGYAHYYVGVARNLAGDAAGAHTHLAATRRLLPHEAEYAVIEGNLFLAEQNYPAAFAIYQEVATNHPVFVPALLGMARAGSRIEGRMPEARRALERARALQWGNAVVWAETANFALADDNPGSAIASFSQSLALDDKQPQVANHLAWLLATQTETSEDHRREALRWARHACQLTPRPNPAFQDTLAAALAANGEFPEATRVAEAAIDLARQAGENSLAERIAARLARYRQNLPYYREPVGDPPAPQP